MAQKCQKWKFQTIKNLLDLFLRKKSKNHLPPHKLHPNRLNQQIKCGNIDISGFALSNLESLEQANAFYHYLQKVCKNVKKRLAILYLLEY